MAHLISIVYQPIGREYDDPYGDFMREPLEQAELVVDHGLRGDRKAGHNPNRQVNLLSADWLAAAAAQGYRAGPGQFGEQLIVAGLELIDLLPGARLLLGDAAVLEIVKGRTGCDRLEAAQGKSIKGLGPIGVLAHVIEGGHIRLGDPVVVAPVEIADPA